MEQKTVLTAEECERIYQNALLLIDGGLFSEAYDELSRIPDYKDAAEKMRECEKRKETAKLDTIYAEADKAASNFNVRSQEKAIRTFERIRGYRDADERIEQAKRTIEEIRTKERDDREKNIRKAKLEEQKRKQRNKRILRAAIIAGCVAALCAVGVILFNKYAVPAIRYDRAIKQYEAGEVDEAYLALHGMHYRDSSDLIYDIAKDRLKGAEIGSVVLFGAYPQGRITDERKDPVEWIVLDKDGSRLLLISKYALDSLPYMRYDYDSTSTNVSWQTSLLREWLNSEFLGIAFDNAEIRMLQRTMTHDEMSGMLITDRVFLLNIDEARTYFPTDESRRCLATQYALGYGAYRSSIGETCLWWLRTPADKAKIAEFLADEATERVYFVIPRIACVNTDGEIIEVGHEILNRGYAVRPAMWIDTEATGALELNK